MPRKNRPADDRGFGELLKEIRLRERLALATFAHRIGMTAANLCDVEQGRRVPGPQRALAIAQRLGLAAELLLSLSLESQLARKDIHCRISVKLQHPPNDSNDSNDSQERAGADDA